MDAYARLELGVPRFLIIHGERKRNPEYFKRYRQLKTEPFERYIDYVDCKKCGKKGALVRTGHKNLQNGKTYSYLIVRHKELRTSCYLGKEKDFILKA